MVYSNLILLSASRNRRVYLLRGIASGARMFSAMILQRFLAVVKPPLVAFYAVQPLNGLTWKR
jgi:hypothetical protein